MLEKHKSAVEDLGIAPIYILTSEARSGILFAHVDPKDDWQSVDALFWHEGEDNDENICILCDSWSVLRRGGQ